MSPHIETSVWQGETNVFKKKKKNLLYFIQLDLFIQGYNILYFTRENKLPVDVNSMKSLFFWSGAFLPHNKQAKTSWEHFLLTQEVKLLCSKTT